MVRESMFCLMDYPIIDLAGRTLGLVGYSEWVKLLAGRVLWYACTCDGP